MHFLIPSAALAAASVSAFALLLSAAPAANAQANLTFTGGNGSPLTVTLASPIVYKVTSNGTGPFFVFDGVGGPTGSSAVTGSLIYSINGGSSQTLNTLRNNFVGGAVTADDLLTYGNLTSITVGDLVTLSSGTLTTTGNVGGAPPANGSFTTFLTDKSGTRIASVAGPEPGSVALILTGISVVVFGRTRRRQSKADKQTA